MLGIPVDKFNCITCHMGNGSSFTAVKGGKSYDTSMGMTPLEGLVMERVAAISMPGFPASWQPTPILALPILIRH